jgi:RHS repeat-associated protein
MKTANYVIAVILMLVLGFYPVLTFAKPKDNARTTTFSSRRLPSTPRPRRILPKVFQAPASIDGQTSTTLADGGVLLIGGMDRDQPTRSIKIFNPGTGKSRSLPDMAQARAWHTATVLPDGRVFVFGGVGNNQRVLSEGLVVDPISGKSTDVTDKGALVARAYHTASLITDGRVLIVGGKSKKGNPVSNAQLWDYRSETVESAGTLSVSRAKHIATLSADGNVLIEGGVDEFGAEIKPSELFNVETKTFSLTTISSEQNGGETPFVAASMPADRASEVPLDSKIVLRFSQRLSPGIIKQAINFEASGEGVAVKIVPAENGRLAFINPVVELRKGATYKISVNGPADGSFSITPTAILFTTVTDKSPVNAIVPSGDLDWTPGPENMHGNWQSKLPKSNWEDQPPLLANPGVTAVAGKVLTLTGLPLPDVTLSINGASTRTDSSGRFLLNISAGHYVMVIDGRTANRPGKTYGIFKTRVEITEGKTNVLDYTIWMPKLDMAHAVTIPSPTNRDIVITNPTVPGLELHLPAGTVIRDLDGKVVTQLSITPIPTDRPPIPLPVGLNVPVFASIQPGGAKLIPPRARLIYPNYINAAPGKRLDFWNYDPEGKGWYIYGQGTVSDDGRQIIPDPGVVIYEFSGIMHSDSGNPADKGRKPGQKTSDGDPVDLGTGLFVLEKTDFFLPDTLSLKLTRTYRPGDPESRAFGVGSTHPYDMFLWSNNNYNEVDLILADGSRIHYVRVSPGTAYWDAVYEHTSSPSKFYKSQIYWNGSGGWDLRLTDGTIFVFPEYSPLQAIRDRYGNQITVTRAFGVIGNITQLTSPNGRWLQFSYGSGDRISQVRDNTGRTINYTYDSSGRLWKVTDPNGGVTEYTYDTAHRMLTAKDGRGITFLTNEYDSNGRVIRQTQPENSVYEFAYTLNGSGNITQTDVTDPRGNVRRVTFNSDGYSLTDTRGLATSAAQTFTYERQSGTNLVLGVTDSLNRRTSYTYDSYGNILTVTRMAGTGEAKSTTFTYEPNFHDLATITDTLNHTTSYAYDTQGNLISVTDPLNHQTSLAYNSAGQITSVTDALNNTGQWTYLSGDLYSLTDPIGATVTQTTDTLGRTILKVEGLGRANAYEYDVRNQPTQVTDAKGGSTSFSYDANGNLLTVTDPNNHSTTYTYDDLDRLETRTDALSRLESYEYDGLGNVTKSVDRRGKVTAYSYDALNRRIFAGFDKVINGGSTTYESTIAYTYDTVGRLIEANDSLAGVITFVYDNFDRITSATSPQGTISYTYDAADRRTSMTVSGRAAINYTYDNANRLTGVSQGSSSVAYTYDNANRRTSLTLTNGLVTEYGYDAASNLTSITYKQGTTVLGDLTYEYDATRRRTKVGGSYARTGLPSALTSATFDAANQMTQRASSNLSYDFNGNLTNDGVNTYTWNARNQLSSISGGISASFVYDALGRRIRKTVNSQTTDYLYDGIDIVQESSGGTPTADMLHGYGIDERLMCNCDGASRTLLADALGNTIALTISTGAVQTEYTYDPFGQTSVSGTASTNAAQYTGRENDGTGLYHYRARYYSPMLQRFISEDPSGFGGGDVNLYAYASNNPVGFTDPSGLKSDDIIDALQNFVDGVKDFLSNTLLPAAAAEAGGPMMEGAGAAAKAAATGSKGADTYEILDGVRRAKAAEMLGHKTIPANIYDAAGNLVGKTDIPIDSLRSPKDLIDIAKEVDALRWQDTFTKTKAGSPIPPITVQPGSRGIPIKDVTWNWW